MAALAAAGGAAAQALVGLRIMVYGVGPREMAANAAQPSLPDWYGDAIPYYAALIVLEFAVARARGKALYRASDSACGVMLGLAQTLAAPWFQWLRLTTFAWVHAHLRFASLDPSLWSTYAATFASVDLAYYWMHRCAHEFHALWSAHSVHHSGEDYNLATSLRQGLHQQAFSWLFRVPVVLFVSPKVMLQHDALNVIFMFLLHTPLVGSLGPLERVFNTPSHHRMHHRPPGNCNYGGLLIVWDVIFGTFVPEDEQQDYYGLAKPLESWDPLWASLEHLKRMRDNGVGLLTRRVRWRWAFRPQDLFAAWPAPSKSLWRLPDTSKRAKYQGSASLPWHLSAYTYLLFGASVALAGAVLAHENRLAPHELALAQAAAFAMFGCVGRLLDGDNMAASFNSLRVLAALSLAACSRAFEAEPGPIGPVFQAVALADAALWTLAHGWGRAGGAADKTE